MNAAALRLLAVGSEDTVLEVGFGGGALLADILAAGPKEVTGVELSPPMIARAHRRFHRAIKDGQVRLLQGSVNDLPLRDGSIDKACSLNSLYFWDRPSKALEELARVISPGGSLILGIEAAELLREWPGHRYGFSLFEPEDVIGLARRAGFGDAVVHEDVEPRYGRIYCIEFKRR